MNGVDKYKFSGHETFVFRHGWLEKGVRGVQDHPNIFSRDDALVILGVGKNMVSSIRHWCQVTQLIEPDPAAKGAMGRRVRVSEIGKRLLLQGWDPFLEDDASLWLIHWLIVSNPNIGTSGQLLFSSFNRPDFAKQELVDFIVSYAEKESLRVSETVIARDVDCLVRTYAITSNGKKNLSPEETFNCPLLQLELIQPSPDGSLYRFAIGPKPSLPTAIFAFAFHQYFDGDRSTMSIQECLYGHGSPGQAFKLDENSLMDYLEELEVKTGGNIMLDETAGLKQVYRRQTVDSMGVLDDYYWGSKLK